MLQRLSRSVDLAQMKTVAIASGQVVYQTGDRVTDIYFPCSGMISLVADFGDGHAIEVGCVGREGMVGIESFLGGIRAQRKALGQIEGESYVVPAAKLQAAFAQNENVRSTVLAYFAGIHKDATQTAACNLSHSLEERLARWLLIAGDRTASDLLPLTHEFISQMVGARRSSVTISLGILQESGLIRHKRGKVELLDRGRLETTACECYAANARSRILSSR